MSNTIQHSDWMEVAETLQAVSDNIRKLTPEYTFFHGVMKGWRLTTFGRESVSIITRELEQPFVVVENGEALTKAVAIQEHPTFNELASDVESVIKSEKDFVRQSDGSRQTIIIPMRLRDKRILGAFILSRQDEAYSDEEVAIVDQFSNRIALLLNTVLQSDHATNAEDFRLKMVENNHNASRQAILASALEFLIYSKKGNSTAAQQRFEKKEVHLFLYDVVDSEKLYHEINAGNLTYSSDQSKRTPIPIDGSDSDIPMVVIQMR